MDRIFQYFIKLLHGDVEIIAVFAALFVAFYLVLKKHHEIKKDIYEMAEKKLDKFTASIKESLKTGSAADRFQSEYYFSLIFKAKLEYETIKVLIRFPSPYLVVSDYVASEEYVALNHKEMKFILKKSERFYRIKKFIVKAWSLFSIILFLLWFCLIPLVFISYMKGVIDLGVVSAFVAYLIPLAFILYIAGESSRKVYAAERLMKFSKKP